MFKQSVLLLVALAIVASAEMGDQEIADKLKAAGMSDNGLSILAKMAEEFKTGHAAVAGNDEAEKKFLADFGVKSQQMIDSMTPQDKKIYNENSEAFD